jgi:hypothetical protein
VVASAAGTVGSVNPCGLALLPAFLPIDATTPAGRRRVAWRRVAQASWAGPAMTATFAVIDSNNGR